MGSAPRQRRLSSGIANATRVSLETHGLYLESQPPLCGEECVVVAGSRTLLLHPSP